MPSVSDVFHEIYPKMTFTGLVRRIFHTLVSLDFQAPGEDVFGPQIQTYHPNTVHLRRHDWKPRVYRN